MNFSAEDILKHRERVIGRQRDQWRSQDWQDTAELLARVLDDYAIAANETLQATKSLADYTLPKRRRGRPRKRPGLWMLKRRGKAGRKPQKNRRELGIALKVWVDKQQKAARKEGKRLTDKAAVGHLLEQLAVRQAPKMRVTRFVRERYSWARNLLTEGRKLVLKSGKK